MKEDDILAQVRDHVRGERANDAALEAVARGETSSAAIAELEQRAAKDPEVKAMLEASRPLGEVIEDRIVNANAKADAKANAKADANANANADAKAGRLVPFSRRLAVLAAPFAVAAAVLVYVVAGRRGQDGGALLPDYAVAASSDQTMRGAVEPTRAALTLRGAEGSFEIVARPSTTAGAKVVAYAFAMGEGEPNAVDAKIEISPEGSIRIRGRGRALQGAREVRVVIGTASDSIARYDDALARARDGKSDAHVRVLVVPITRE